MARSVRSAVVRAFVPAALAAAAFGWSAAGAVAAASPDVRGYELVSPGIKNGGDVMGDSTRTRAAGAETPSLPMAVSFASLTGFADARGTGVATEYLSERDGQTGTSGWATHAITPPQDPVTLFGNFNGGEPVYVGDFSADLTMGIFRAWSPLTNAPTVKDVVNLYRRSDLRTAGVGSYQLLTDSATTVSPSSQKPYIAGASTDLSHVLFESKIALTAGGPPQPPSCAFNPNACHVRLYESVNGAVRLVGVLPDGTVADRSVAGLGASLLAYTPHVISANGSRVVFSDITDQFNPSLYQRDDHGTADTSDDTTLKVNASERTPPAVTPAPAQFWDASADGSRVFFTSPEPLTNAAPNTTGVPHLYMWDANAPAGSHLTMLDVDSNPTDDAQLSEGVIGASDDGHYVYFIAHGQLVAGAPAGIGLAAYLWHDGQVDYVGQLDSTILNLPNKAWTLGPNDARVPPDGKHLLFSASSGVGLTGYDQQSNCTDAVNPDAQPGCTELYVYSADNHHLSCASCDPSGAPATDDADDNTHVGTGGASTTWHLNRAISDDGSRVFFNSPESLVPSDTNGKVDAYEYDVADGSLHLISTGKDTADSFFLDASASGSDAFFITRQKLVGWDIDGNYDLYDARLGGGFPDPPVPPPACVDDSCHGPLSLVPTFAPAGSATFRATGTSATPTKAKPKARPKAKPVKCKRGYVRKKVKGKVKCVKQKHRKAKSTRASIRKATR